MAERKVLVAGALGVVGRAVVEHLAARSDAWEVVALSRRGPDFETPARFVAVDLRDAEATRAALSTHADASHLVYAALFERPQLARGWSEPDHIEINRAIQVCYASVNMHGVWKGRTSNPTNVRACNRTLRSAPQYP